MEDIKAIEIIIAALVLVVAYFQWRTNERLRKQDLYDKRWNYYVRAKKDFLAEFTNWANGSETSDFSKHIKNYVSSYADEAFFLFGKDIEKHVRNTVPQMLRKTGEKTIEDPITSFRLPFEKYLRIKS